ncbi:MAG: amidohydrolase [Lachnospiraceae bacterium]|nr:amidohydrolase [Lachnospiraceae bacterium]
MSKILIRDAYALVDGKIDRHSIYITDDRISGVDEMPDGFKEDTLIDGNDLLVIPGLINAHTHSYMAPLRNIADDMPFMDWLFKGVNPVEEKMTGEDAYYGAMLAIIEMIMCGTTTFNDMQMHIHQTTKAVKDSGMRAVISRGLVGSTYDRNDVRIREALEEMEDGKDCDRLSFMLGPHAPYTCGPDYLRCVADTAKEKGLGIHIHLAESLTEIENLRKDHNCTAIEYAQKAGCFEVPAIAAHCVNVTDDDINILKENNVSVVTNPASNMKLGNGFAPVPKFLEAGINVAIGTDGAASNNSLNLFHELSLLTLIHKGVAKDPVCIGAAEAMKIATENGAKALGLEDVTGKIRKGYKADLALLNLNTPSMIPPNNMISSLVYSANGSEVDTVIIDGAIVMQNREIKTIDTEKVFYEAKKIVKM